MEIVGVRFNEDGKVYYFNPNGLSLKVNLTVIVNTEKGIRFGKIVDIKESDGLISMAYLYQDKELIERHGIGVIIDNTYYKIGIGPDIVTTLNNNSKIIKITDDEVVFTFNLDNDMKKKRLTVKSENKDIHFKLEDIN